MTYTRTGLRVVAEAWPTPDRTSLSVAIYRARDWLASSPPRKRLDEVLTDSNLTVLVEAAERGIEREDRPRYSFWLGAQE